VIQNLKSQVFLISAYTQQYTDFNPLIEKNRENGKEFTILAFPCNQFYLQEPAENHELLNGTVQVIKLAIDSNSFSGIVHVRPGNGW
jgi:glutathione peroxidase